MKRIIFLSAIIAFSFLKSATSLKYLEEHPHRRAGNGLNALDRTLREPNIRKPSTPLASREQNLKSLDTFLATHLESSLIRKHLIKFTVLPKKPLSLYDLLSNELPKTHNVKTGTSRAITPFKMDKKEKSRHPHTYQHASALQKPPVKRSLQRLVPYQYRKSTPIGGKLRKH